MTSALIAQPPSDLIYHPRFGEIFQRAWSVWQRGKVPPVRGSIGVVRASKNVVDRAGVITRQFTYYPDPAGAGCCFVGAAMLGLECRYVVRDGVTVESVSWLSYLTTAEKRGLLHGFDGLPASSGYDARGHNIVSGDPAHDPEAYEFGQRSRVFVETALGGIPWVGKTADPAGPVVK